MSIGKGCLMSMGLLVLANSGWAAEYVLSAHAVDGKSAAHWSPADGPPGPADTVRIDSTPTVNAWILASDFTVQQLVVNGGSQFTQIGTASAGGVTLTVRGDLVHRGTGSALLFRGSTGGNRTDTLSVHIEGNLGTWGGQVLEFGQHRADTRYNYALAGLQVSGKTIIDDGGSLRIFTNGSTARFGEVVLGTNGRNTLLLNHGVNTDEFGSQFSPARVVEIAGLSGGNGVSGRVAATLDRKLNAGPVTLRLTGDGTYVFGGQIVNRADGSVGSSLVALEKSGSGVQVLTDDNVWGGPTVVKNGGLIVDGSHTGRGADYTVGYGAWLGGGGTLELADHPSIASAKIVFQPGARLVFESGRVLTVNSNSSGNNTLTVDLAPLMAEDLVQRDGRPVDWTRVQPGIYPLMDGTAAFANVNPDWSYDVGGSGKDARLRVDGGLKVEVVPGSGKQAVARVVPRPAPEPEPQSAPAPLPKPAPQSVADLVPPSRKTVLPSAPVEVAVSTRPFEIRDAVDWPAFMAAHDLVWTATPKQWNEGGFTGNGLLGIMAYATLDDNRFDFHLGRSDVTDHRGAPDQKTSFGVLGKNVMFDFCRLDVGRMALRPAGQIESVTMRQHLWDAELRGTLKTDLGELQFRAVTLRDEMAHVIEVVSSEKTADGQDADWRWEFMPGNPDSPRFQIIGRERAPNYEQNPRPVLKTIGGISVVEQPLRAGGCHATAWGEVRVGARHGRLILSTANELPPAGSSAPVAAETVRRIGTLNFEALLAAHRDAWHALYRRSFLTIPDPRLESFYWIQLYKFASGARADGPPIDLLGPWFRTTIWPGIWWNLNVQLTYWLPGMANQLDLSHTLPAFMDRYWETMLARYGQGSHPGDLAWALHNYWLHYRLAGDWNALATQWRPKAVQMLEVFGKRIEEGPDGRLHLTPMGSPEFKGFEKFKDTNYNLALIRWLALSLDKVSEHAGTGTEEAARWRAVADRLIDPPVDASGFMIGSDQPFNETHRHWSHLLGFYPLYLFDTDDPEMNALLQKSVYHWLNLKNAQGKRDRCGYTVAGAASMLASIGDGDQAFELLDGLLDHDLGPTLYGSRILPNAFYTEVHGLYPTIETPFAAASATIELVLQSWGDRVRVFPAVPEAWEKVRFRNLRAQGGFLVSAERKNGRTAWVAVESLAGEPLVLRVPDWQENLVALADQATAVRSLGNGDFAIELCKGGRVLLSPTSAPVSEAVLSALPRGESERHFYGVRPDNQLDKNQASPYDIPLRLDELKK